MSNDLFTNMSGHICASCGAEVTEGNKFCVRCGSPVQRTAAEAAPVSEASVSGAPDYVSFDPAVPNTAAFAQTTGAAVSTVQTAPPPLAVRQQVMAPSVTDADPIPNNKSKYQPISTGGYIGIWLLMALPAINLLLLIVWACGGCRKINKRNFARSMLVVWAVLLILGVILSIVFRNAINSLYPFAPSFGSF